MTLFIGRKRELERLHLLHKKPMPTLVVVKGRRRIGKSRLIHEFAQQVKNKRFWSFAGLAPSEGVSAQDQRDNFTRQLAAQLQLPVPTFFDWSDAFDFFSVSLRQGDLVLFDEISWMGSKDQTFIPKLKAWWDRQMVQMLLVFCGSVSTWIEENILKNTAFFGRIHLTLTLEPLSIPESAELLRKIGMHLSFYDMYKLLSIFGGVPWYLEQCHSSMTADALIKELCFERGGLLVTEFDRIFHDLFNGKGATYQKILHVLKDGAKTLSEIRQSIDFTHSGTLSTMLEHLIVAGFISKQPLWSFKTSLALKQSLYRIADPYMRFYLKMIEPHKEAILGGAFDAVPVSTMSAYDTQMGLQLEVLLLQNRPLIQKALGVSPIDTIRSGPYRQNKTTKQQGCQIDFLLQSKTNTLFVCEFKFKRREISSEIITEMEQKIARLKVSKGFARVPVLCHLGGVADAVAVSSYFYRIIDITDFLEQTY